MVKAKVGHILTNNLDGETFVVEKIVDEVAVLRSRDGKRKISGTIGSLDSLYRKEIPGVNTGIERRRQSRSLVIDDVMISVHNSDWIFGKAKDVNTEGLSFEHLEPTDERKVYQESSGWNLCLLVSNFILYGVPCRVVYDISFPPSTEQGVLCPLQTNRCGVQFQTLSDNQKILLASFVEKYTKRAKKQA